MANESDAEKTEEATDAKREEFRRQGQVAQTRELASASLFFAAAAMILLLGKFYMTHLSELFDASLGLDMVKAVRQGEATPLILLAGKQMFFLLSPVLLIVGILGFFSTVAQIGFLQVEDALTPNFERINPISGLGRIFSLRSLAEGIKSVLKLTVVALVLYFLLKAEIQTIPRLMSASVAEICAYLGMITVKLLFTVGIITLVFAAADYFFQRWDLNRKMMMTKQEIKEEVKQREGDPHIKARIRRIQREMANRRMMAEIPKADVVVTNPTHIAIVLKYGDNLPAPMLVAKGADLVAEKIKEIAREAGIPIIENKPLARTVFKTLKIGQVIPRELFVAVAEVLSYVYKLKRKKVK
jgi:flagellar biosynthesis protein FlhB